MKILKIILKYKYVLFILIILLSVIRSNIYVKSKYDIKENEFYGVITDYKIKDTYVTFTLKGREMTRKEENKRSILEFIVMMEDVAMMESNLIDNGNRVIVTLKKR